MGSFAWESCFGPLSLPTQKNPPNLRCEVEMELRFKVCVAAWFWVDVNPSELPVVKGICVTWLFCFGFWVFQIHSILAGLVDQVGVGWLVGLVFLKRATGIF